MRSAPRSLALLAVLVALLAPATAGVAVADAQSGTVPVSDGSAAVAPVPPAPAVSGAPAGHPSLSEPVNTTIRVELHANTSARWSVVVTYELESDEERTAFQEYVDEYRNRETDAGPAADTFRAIAERAAATTGREMRIENATRSGTVGDEHGSITLSFRWTAMLDRTSNRTLRLDDTVLLSGNRTWLSTIEANQRLIIETPQGYSIVDSSGPSFDIRNNAVVIEGPRTLESPLSVTYRRTATTPSPPDGTGTGQGPIVGGAVLLVAALLVVLYLWRGGSATPVSSNGGTDTGGGAAESGPDAATTAEADTGAETGAAADRAEATGTAGEDTVDLDLLSDEERVEHLLEQNDGRMKQATIVNETGWSDAKVSQLLSSMADEGRVEKLRLGRENLISLPDEEPDENG